MTHSSVREPDEAYDPMRDSPRKWQICVEKYEFNAFLQC